MNETELVVSGFKYSPWAELAPIFTSFILLGCCNFLSSCSPPVSLGFGDFTKQVSLLSCSQFGWFRMQWMEGHPLSVLFHAFYTLTCWGQLLCPPPRSDTFPSESETHQVNTNQRERSGGGFNEKNEKWLCFSESLNNFIHCKMGRMIPHPLWASVPRARDIISDWSAGRWADNDKPSAPVAPTVQRSISELETWFVRDRGVKHDFFPVCGSSLCCYLLKHLYEERREDIG